MADSENKPLPDSTTSPKGETKESGAEAGFRTPPKSETAPTPRHVEEPDYETPGSAEKSTQKYEEAIYVVESPDIFAAEGSTPKQEKKRARVSLEFTAEITENPEGCMLDYMRASPEPRWLSKRTYSALKNVPIKDAAGTSSVVAQAANNDDAEIPCSQRRNHDDAPSKDLVDDVPEPAGVVTLFSAEIKTRRETVTLEMHLDDEVHMSFFRRQNRLARRMVFTKSEFHCLVESILEFQDLAFRK